MMTGKELVKKLEANGWVLDHVNGSHHIMKKEGASSHLSIPVHSGKDLRKGLLHKILKEAGLK